MAAEERKRRSAILKQAQDKVDLAETTVNELEARQQALTDELEKPETYANGPRIVEINQELTMIAQSLEEAMAHWEGAQQTLETIQQDLQAQESA